jgi:hypothetical protein
MGWVRGAGATFAVVLVVGACGHEARAPASAPAPSPAPSADRDLGDDIPDPKDRCPWILDGCTDTSGDEDGCPDVSLQIPDCRLAASDDSWLGEVEGEVAGKSDLTVVRIVSGVQACADAVRAALVKRGIPASRLETKTVPGRARDVSFEAAVWKGQRCP